MSRVLNLQLDSLIKYIHCIIKQLDIDKIIIIWFNGRLLRFRYTETFVGIRIIIIILVVVIIIVIGKAKYWLYGWFIWKYCLKLELLKLIILINF